MKTNIKHFLRKNAFLHSIFFRLKIVIAQLKYFLLRKKRLKFQILILESKFNNAHDYFKDNMFVENQFLYSDFNQYLSLSLRLRKFIDLSKLNKKIFNYQKWNPVFYVFLRNQSKRHLLSKWLKRVFKNDKSLIKILDNPKYFSNKEKTFFSLFSNYNKNIDKTRLIFKEIISQMYFNDMQFNDLYYFSILEHMTRDYQLNNNSPKKKRLAILNLDPWTQSIGHFYYLDSFIKGVILGILDYDKIKFSEEPKSIISNVYLYNIYKDVLDKKFSTYNNKNYISSEPNLDAWRCKNKNFVHAHQISHKIQKIWKQKKNEPLAKISNPDLINGKKFIKKITKYKKKWYCTLHIREPGFRLNDHLWLDTGRNASIENYKTSIDYIDKKGGFTIKLGQKNLNRLNLNGLFDYGSSNDKSDFLDIYLISQGKFNIGTGSGLSYLPIIFGNYANIFTNMSIPYFVHIPGSIGIPKLIYSYKTNKLQNLSIYKKFSPPLLFYGNENFKNLGYQLAENSPEDLLLLVKEFLNNFKKKNWNKDLKKRKKFILKSNNNIYTKNFIPMPKSFINKYKNIL